MFEKVKALLPKVTARLNSMRTPIKWVIYAYLGMVAMLVITYYGAWLWLWKEGEVVLGDLLSLIQEMVGTSMVAFVTFIAGCMVDSDHDGIPDRFEEDETNENRD